MTQNAITPAASALNTAARDVEQIDQAILRMVQTIRERLNFVEGRIRAGYHADSTTGIPELDERITRRQDHIETQKLLRYALGKDA